MLQISLLRVVGPGEFSSVADLVASVEAVPGSGDVLFVRLHEGPASELLLSESARTSGDAKRLESLLSGLVDVPLILQVRPSAHSSSCLRRLLEGVFSLCSPLPPPPALADNA